MDGMTMTDRASKDHLEPAHRPGSQAERSMRTRQRILEAAHAVFVREGFAGAKIEHIAEAAKTNKRLVYHHFGGKDELFRTVLETAYAAMRQAEQGLGLDLLAPRDAVTRLIRFTWTYYLEHEDFISLVATENLCKAEHIAASEHLPRLRSSLVELMRDIVRRGETSGEFRPGLDPVQLWISISAMCWFSVANKHTIAATFGQAAANPAIGEDRLAHILSVVHAFLAPLADKPAPSDAMST
ncbi:TetR/AcrR family transcriptional regulator [Methylobacterium oryzihabitans]|uniref:TetR/AcrR family transcriptional regulator n=2 Tax=Methylobacterium oryzihabitans TaxID=2499852 RepID=A0A3S2WFQ8_9HYPH|nr:TetR/AcrR family transcriptional regulator [Methylobacterium oryzihabitans]